MNVLEEVVNGLRDAQRMGELGQEQQRDADTYMDMDGQEDKGFKETVVDKEGDGQDRDGHDDVSLLFGEMLFYLT